MVQHDNRPGPVLRRPALRGEQFLADPTVGRHPAMLPRHPRASPAREPATEHRRRDLRTRARRARAQFARGV